MALENKLKVSMFSSGVIEKISRAKNVKETFLKLHEPDNLVCYEIDQNTHVYQT